MDLTVEVKGKIHEIMATTQVSDKFKKREFVVEVENEKNPDWNDFLKLQVTQDRCFILDGLSREDIVKCNVGLKGKKYEKDGKVYYFNTLDCYRIEKIDANTPSSGTTKKTEPTESTNTKKTSKNTEEEYEVPTKKNSDHSNDANEDDDLPF